MPTPTFIKPEVKAAFNTIRASGALINPIDVSSFLTRIGSLRTIITGFGLFGNLVALDAILNNLETTLPNIEFHTDVISGVVDPTPSPSKLPFGVRQGILVATSNNVAAGLDDNDLDTVEDKKIKLFGSILGELDSIFLALATSLTFLENESGTQLELDAEAIIQTPILVGIEASLASVPATEDANLQTELDRIKDFGLASQLDGLNIDPDNTYNDLLNIIASPQLKTDLGIV